MTNQPDERRAKMLRMTPEMQKEFDHGSFLGFPLAEMSHDELKVAVAWMLVNMRAMQQSMMELTGLRR